PKGLLCWRGEELGLLSPALDREPGTIQHLADQRFQNKSDVKSPCASIRLDLTHRQWEPGDFELAVGGSFRDLSRGQKGTKDFQGHRLDADTVIEPREDGRRLSLWGRGHSLLGVFPGCRHGSCLLSPDEWW